MLTSIRSVDMAKHERDMVAHLDYFDLQAALIRAQDMAAISGSKCP